MFTIGILNIALFSVGMYFLISSGWQFTGRSRDRRIKLSAVCWLAGIVIGATAYATNCGT